MRLINPYNTSGTVPQGQYPATYGASGEASYQSYASTPYNTYGTAQSQNIPTPTTMEYYGNQSPMAPSSGLYNSRVPLPYVATQQSPTRSPHGLPSLGPSPGQMHHPGQIHHQPQHVGTPMMGQQPAPYQSSRNGNMHGFRDAMDMQSVGQHHYTVQPATHNTVPQPGTKRVRSSEASNGHQTLNINLNLSNSQTVPRSHQNMADAQAGGYSASTAMDTTYMDGSHVNGNSSGSGNDSNDRLNSSELDIFERLEIDPDVLGECTTESEEVVLSQNASAEDRYLFQLTRDHRHILGKGMWEAVNTQYNRTYRTEGKNTAALQMRLTRVFRRQVQWPMSETKLLLQAWEEDNIKRHERVLAALKERGGGKVYEWKAADVELILVRLGLEEPSIDEKSGMRRKKQQQQTSARTASVPSQDTTPMVSTAVWDSQYPPLGTAQPPQYGPQGASQRGLTNAELEAVNQQLDRKYASSVSSISPEGDDMHTSDNQDGIYPLPRLTSTMAPIVPMSSISGSYGPIGSSVSSTLPLSADRMSRDRESSSASYPSQTDRSSLSLTERMYTD